jgi:hypothetical protein
LGLLDKFFIFAHGLATARCDDCGHNYFVAYSCNGRRVCCSGNKRRMVETVAHLTDHVFPRMPVREWVLSVSKRLRYFIQLDGAALNVVCASICGTLRKAYLPAALVRRMWTMRPFTIAQSTSSTASALT